VTARRHLLIFDCDGVLFDSERANIAFYNEVLRRAEQPPLDGGGSAAAWHALASTALFESFFRGRPELLARVLEIAKATDYTPFYALMEPHPNLRSILHGLRRYAHTAMATNRGKTTRQVLTHFGFSDLFDLAVGAHDVARPKPEPDMLLHCLEHFSIEPRNAVYVGDQESDFLAAQAAGMHFIGVGAVRDMVPLSVRSLDDIEAVVGELFDVDV